MSNPLLTLGQFAFSGLESPERINLKSKQRLAVHHLGSGRSVSDSLGEEYEIVTFRGIFAGTNASERIRQIESYRLMGRPLDLTWGSTVLSVIIQAFELDYLSELWVPYRLSCYVVRPSYSGNVGFADMMFLSPMAQMNDILYMIQDTGIAPTSDQSTAIVTLAGFNYDRPSSDLIEQVMLLVGLIDDRIAELGPEDLSFVSLETLHGDFFSINGRVAGFGSLAMLILARNRVLNIVVSSQDFGIQ